MRSHDLAIASSLVSGGFTFNFAQSRLQQLDENYYGLYGSADATIPICPDADFKLSVVGGPYWRDTDFEGIERNTANFGPMGNRDLTLNFAEKEGSWGAHGRAAAGIEYRLGGGLSLTAGASIEYRSEVGKVVNPNSGDQVFFQGQTTRLEQDDASAWNAFLGARFSF